MSLILGLWSIVLEPGKTYTQKAYPAIQITNIAYGPEVKGSERSVVTMKYPEFEQEDSDSEDDEDDSDDEEEDSEDGADPSSGALGEDDEDEEDSDDEDDLPVRLPNVITKEAVIAHLKPGQTEQVSVNISLVEDVEVVEFSVSGSNAVHLVGHYIRQEDFDQDPYSDSEFDDESIDSELADEDIDGLIDDDSEMEEAGERIQEVPVVEAAPSKKRPAEDTPEKPAAAAAAVNGVEGLSKNQKKKLAKKLKGADGSAQPAPAAAAPAPAAAKPAAAPAAAAAAAPKKDGKKKAEAQTLPGGLIVEDGKKGDGPVAKPGKRVSMRYIGKLNGPAGKVFDSNTKGSPLTFSLGRGEVIKGWDQGIVGLAVGGERKLTIPAALAYGKKGAPPDIPPNATLYFEVKLLAVK